MNRLGSIGLAAALVCGACAEPEFEKPSKDDTKADSFGDGKSEAWGTSDNPAGFNANLEYKVAALPLVGEATNIPWASSYWPVYEDSINHKWGAEDPASTKYGRAFGVTGVEDAVSQYHGIDAQASRKECSADSECTELKDGSKCAKRAGASKGRCIPTWWGICHAWAPAAILMPEPKYPVTHNGVTFKVNDIKALITLVHNSTNSKFVSLRCNDDEANNGINFDNYGRPTGSQCRDTNAGTFHVLMTNYLGVMKQSFVYDRTYDDEVWNQPLRGYKITSQTEVTASEANRLIGVTTVGGNTAQKSGTVAKDEWKHEQFSIAAGQIVKVSMTGTGDVDLYVKFGAQPTANSYDCRPYAGGSTESCELTAPPGATTVYVSFNGYAASSTYNASVTVGGSVPVDYQFNMRAVKFYKVSAEVYYISESASSTDGNLGNRIDQYTHTDHYEYILEVDADGKIVGGEWLGDSKTGHPDFVWLPTGVRGASVAGGKITYANVKLLADLSQNPPGGGGGGTGGERTVNESGTLAKAQWKHLGPFNVAAGTTLTANLSGSGDADLYVRKNTAPTLAAYDCRPYKSGSTESCAIVGPAVVYVAVNGYATSSNFDLVVKYTEGTGGGGTTPPPPPSFTHLSSSGSVALGEWKLFQLPIPAGKKVVIRTQSAADVDLYIQMNQAPTESAYLGRAWTTSGNESLTYTATESGTLFIGVHGYAAGNFTIATSDN